MRRVSIALVVTGLLGFAAPVAATPLVDETTLYALVVVGHEPRCEAWTIVPDTSTPDMGTMTTQWSTDNVRHRLAIDYVRTGARLRFDWYVLDVGDQRARQSRGCWSEHATSWDGRELAMGSARWFASSRACQHAIDAKRPVAMDFQDCDDAIWTNADMRLPAIDDERAMSLQRFEQRLLAGGNMYVIDERAAGTLTCKKIDVARGKRGRYALHGRMSWFGDEITKDGVRSVISTGLRVFDEPQRFRRATDPGYGVTHKEMFVSQGYTWGDSGYATGCGDIAPVWGVANAVELAGNPHYFDRTTCERAISRELARRIWFPRGGLVEDESDAELDEDDGTGGAVAGDFGPGFGGC